MVDTISRDYDSLTKSELIYLLKALDKDRDNNTSKLSSTSSVSQSTAETTRENDKSLPIDEKKLLKQKKQERHQKEQNRLQLSKERKQALTREKRSRRKRPFDFSKCKQRRVALQVCYLGWDYYGLQSQPDVGATIEGCLFDALQKTCLISNREEANYQRCGRTDKGVSALTQTLSLNVRTKLNNCVGLVKSNEKCEGGSADLEDDADELCYPRMLNGVLPSDIRVTAWAPVEKTFNARFDCESRTYKYHFISTGLNIAAMAEAATHLEGTHDFRNFCKIDNTKHVPNHERTIHSFKITRMLDESLPLPAMGSALTSPSRYSDAEIMEFTVIGNSFLWHQVRCMVGVLLLVGQELETSATIDSLLDIKVCKGRPQYNMAPEAPLVLFASQYENLTWRHDEEAHRMLMKTLTDRYESYALRATMVRGFVKELRAASVLPDKGGEPKSWREMEEMLTFSGIPEHYKPLLSRNISTTVEEVFERKAKRAKLAESGSPK
eukprot:CFRG0363T1